MRGIVLPNPVRRGGLRLAALFAVVLVAPITYLLLAAPTGQAAQVITATIGRVGDHIVFRDDPDGLVQNTTASFEGSLVRFKDPNGGLAALPGCTQVTGSTEVTCSLTGITEILVDTGSLNDTFTVAGGPGAVPASVSGGAGSDKIFDGPLGGRLHGNSGNDQLRGSGGDDLLTGGTGADLIDGGDGIDTVRYDEAGRQGGVQVTVGDGVANDGNPVSDRASSFIPNPPLDNVTASIDNVVGSAGGDTLTGTVDVNHLDGGGGDDNVFGGDGGDQLDGGSGNDELHGGNGADTLQGGGVTFFGSSKPPDNLLDGGAGPDTFHGGGGPDRAIGGAGFDTFSYADPAHAAFFSCEGGINSGPGVTATLDGVANDGQFGEGDDVGGSDVEKLVGSTAVDTLTGNSSANTIVGELCPDELRGLGGADHLDANDGIADTVLCGGGTDDAKVDLQDGPAGFSDCETVNQAPVDQHPTVRIRSRHLRLHERLGGRDFTRVTLDCPRRLEQGCKGRLALRAPRTAKRLAGGHRARRILGSSRYSRIAAGSSRPLRVDVRGWAVRKLHRHHHLEITVIAREHDREGRPKVSRRHVTLDRQ